jgi:hypothetical protein
MAHKRKKVMEWVTNIAVAVADDTPITNEEFDLDLMPDEIAEIYIVQSDIVASGISDAADESFDVGMYLSMDPDASADPLDVGESTGRFMEDLEVFFTHSYGLSVNAGGGGVDQTSDSKTLYLPDHGPILLGTNFGHVVSYNSAIPSTESFASKVTVYFKRRKATASELNQILLKRR